MNVRLIMRVYSYTLYDTCMWVNWKFRDLRAPRELASRVQYKTSAITLHRILHNIIIMIWSSRKWRLISCTTLQCYVGVCVYIIWAIEAIHKFEIRSFAHFNNTRRTRRINEACETPAINNNNYNIIVAFKVLEFRCPRNGWKRKLVWRRG